MPTTPPDPAPSPGQDAPKDPVDLLVKALAAVPEADRELVYAWLLRRGSEPGQVTGLAPQRMARRVPVATLLRQNVTLDPGLEAGVTIVSGAQLADGPGPVLVAAACPAAAVVRRAWLLDGDSDPRAGLPVPRGSAPGSGPARLIPRNRGNPATPLTARHRVKTQPSAVDATA